MTYDELFASPGGRTPRGPFLAALVVLAAVIFFYFHLVTGRTATFCMLVLVYPGVVLHARRLRDMGRSTWLLAVPILMLLAAFAIWLGYATFGEAVDNLLPKIALVITIAFALWGALGRSRHRR